MKLRPAPGSQLLDLWHGETNTLPRLRRTVDGIEATLPIGAKTRPLWAPRIDITFSAAVTHADGTRSPVDGEKVSVAPQTLDSIRLRTKLPHSGPVPVALTAPYVDLKQAMLADAEDRFYEYVVTGLPEGSRLDYTMTATSHDAEDRELAASARLSFALQLTAPEFDHTDVHGVLRDAARRTRGIVLVSNDDQYLHLRVDLLAYYPPEGCRPRPPVTFTFSRLASNQSALVDLQAGPNAAADTPIDWLPLIDMSADTVVLSLPRSLIGPDTSVTVTSDAADRSGSPVNSELVLHPLGAPASAWHPTRLLLAQYCIQACNDLFSVPLSAYDPPRTYMQVTLRDEKGRFCSRPAATENHDPDGYSFTFDAHRYYGVKSQWFFNAGVLLLMARDCPDEIRKIRLDLESGLMVAGNAGFGAHRPPYFDERTNLVELTTGADTIRAILWGDSDVPQHRDPQRSYYPDQRLFKATPSELGAYRGAEVKYLVFDRSTACVPAGRGHQSARFPLPNSAPDHDTNTYGNHLWNLTNLNAATGLFIEDRVRDQLQDQTEDEMARGQCCYLLRELFMAGVIDHGPPVVFTYGDDADKASGCGWFDGDYAGAKLHFTRKYEAALCWIAAHPWTESVTTADLEDVERAEPPFTLASSSCPSVDPGGWMTVDAYGKHLHFDSWHATWQRTRATWLDKTLDTLKVELERALVGWRDPKDELVQLAWRYFQLGTHESFWNKEPLEHTCSINGLRGVLEPEDFVISESLQQRNAWVYLCAAIWAKLAAQLRDKTFVDEGPVIAQIRARGLAQGPVKGASANGLFWDHDLLPNVVIYNRQTLAVFDRNGGVLSNLFIMIEGRPISISGTFAAFQFIDTSPNGQLEGAAADGVVMQNTVTTPNHAYIAGDVRQAQPVLGTYTDPRRPDLVLPHLYPNNFDEYRARTSASAVEFTYQPGVSAPAALTMSTFSAALLADHDARIAALRAGQSVAPDAVVWHDPNVAAFTKRIELDRNRVLVRYWDAPANHVVSNELCLDLLRVASQGLAQDVLVGADERTITVVSKSGLKVCLRLGDNCRFRSPSLPRSGSTSLQVLSLRRALSDNVQVVCDAGGAFDYSLELPT